MSQMHCRTASVVKLRYFSALTGMLSRSFAILVDDDLNLYIPQLNFHTLLDLIWNLRPMLWMCSLVSLDVLFSDLGFLYCQQ